MPCPATGPPTAWSSPLVDARTAWTADTRQRHVARRSWGSQVAHRRSRRLPQQLHPRGRRDPDPAPTMAGRRAAPPLGGRSPASRPRSIHRWRAGRRRCPQDPAPRWSVAAAPGTTGPPWTARDPGSGPRAEAPPRTERRPSRHRPSPSPTAVGRPNRAAGCAAVGISTGRSSSGPGPGVHSSAPLPDRSSSDPAPPAAATLAPAAAAAAVASAAALSVRACAASRRAQAWNVGQTGNALERQYASWWASARGAGSASAKQRWRWSGRSARASRSSSNATKGHAGEPSMLVCPRSVIPGMIPAHHAGAPESSHV